MGLEITKEKAEQMCACRQCASFVECSESVAFCFNDGGKSKCIKRKQGCLCGACLVHKDMNFQNVYYCMLGSEKDQSD